MAVFSNISQSSGSPTVLFSDIANPIGIIIVSNDPGSSGVAHVFVTSEKGTAEDEVSIPVGGVIPIGRQGRITGLVGYADTATVTLTTSISYR